MHYLVEIFQYPFMLRAFLVGGVVGITAPLIGTFLYAKRYSLMADTLAHVSLAGIALGLLLGLHPLTTALGVAVLAAALIEYLRSVQKIPGEAALAMFLSGGLAFAITIMSIIHRSQAEVLSYLFGSITTVQPTDVMIIGGVGVIVLVTMTVLYKEFLSVCFNEETAQVQGLPTKYINALLMMLTAITVAIAMRIVGVLLIGALMVIPVMTAVQVARSFVSTLRIAMVSGLLAVLIGLYFSYYFDIVAGGGIVLVALGGFLLASLFRSSR